MKEEIYTRLFEYLQKTENFLVTEIPEVLQQALRYEQYSAIVDLCFSFIGFVALLGLWLYCLKNIQTEKFGNKDFLLFFGCILPVVGFIACFCGMGVSICKIIKISVAPKYYLIQLISGLNK